MILAVVVVAVLAGVVYWFSNTNEPPYRLGVLVVVDQMRPDYLTRFSGDYDNGLHRLQNGGAVFLSAYHDHAATETAVGHATIGSGTIPAHHGIIANNWYDKKRGRAVYACEDSTVRIVGHPEMDGRSPKLSVMPALGDWLRKRSPQSKVLAVSLKDRAAIYMGGHYPDAAYWYDRDHGQFVTSTFYMDTTPAWVDSFNTSGAADRFFTGGWSGEEPEGSFRHPFDTTGKGMKAYYRGLYASPFGDHLLLQFAQTAVDRMALGQDDVPDLLLVSCSTSDVIGHAYGPDSPEIHDYYRRLDVELGKFFDYLDNTVGRNRYYVILGSDHGVMPLPEVLRTHGIDARRISERMVDSTVTATLRTLEKRFHLDAGTLYGGYDGVVIDSGAVAAANLDWRTFEDSVAATLRQAPFLEDVYTSAELADPATPDRPYMKLFRNILFPARGFDLWFRYPEYCLITDDSTGTTHGSPYRYDTQVPIVVYGPGIRSGTYDDSVRTVDIAPTMIDLLGYDVPEGADGRSLMTRFTAPSH